MKLMLLLFVFLAAVGTGLMFVWIRSRQIQVWLFGYFKYRLHQHNTGKPLRRIKGEACHVLFCFVDHYEPGWNKAEPDQQRRRVDAWVEHYPTMAAQFQDSDGHHPRHSWFFPPHYYREDHLRKLVSLCLNNWGEIEMHLHHNRMEPFPDTSETLRRKILDCQKLYSRFGIFQTKVNGVLQTKYAFIHGDWALDNSRPEHCGVNDEITILKETGCFADFTFPSYRVPSQPSQVNSIYYAKDNPHSPKSYDKGVCVKVNGRERGDLLIIPGPLGFRWKGRKHGFVPSIDDGEIAANNPPNQARVDYWVKSGIHVQGKPNWVVVKVFTHGAPEQEHGVLLGESVWQMHDYLRKQYNDGVNYQLHYVTARELYNIIKAAEAGMDGNPGSYRDFVIPPYLYISN